MPKTLFKMIIIIPSICLIMYIIYILFKTNSRTSKQSDLNKVDNKIKKVKDTIDTFIQRIDTLTDLEYFNVAELYHYGQFGKEKDLVMAIISYNKSIDISNESQLKGKCHMGLARVYEEMQTKPVSIDNIINNYLKALEYGYEEAILDIGKIYLYGLHPHYLPDKMVAGRIFSTFINFSNTLHPWCKLHLQDIHSIDYVDLDSMKQRDCVYMPLPFNIEDRIKFSISKMVNFYPYRTSFNNNWLRNFEENDLLLDDLLDDNIVMPVQVIKNDTQNVHDHSLQNIGSQIINKLENTKDYIKTENNFHKNTNELYKSLDENKYPNVKKVCDSYGETNHSRYDKSEQDIFNMVWSKIKDDSDITVMFLDNINSSMEHGGVVCSTGKIMRMLSTLDVVDKDTPDLKPDWVIKDEITQTISKIIRDLRSNEKKEYESEDNERIKAILKTRIRNKCESDYKDILDSSILDIYLNDYFEFL